MHPQKRTMAWIVLLGGGAVLASYAYSLGIDPVTQADLWGGVSPALIVCTEAMATAAGSVSWTLLIFDLPLSYFACLTLARLSVFQ